jgi:serpin B
MLNDGAAGQTASEITSVLGFGEGNAKAVNEFCKTMIDEAPKTDPSVTLEIANTIISNEKRDVQLEEQYSQDMSQYYSAQLSSIDFSKSAEAVGKINAWCKDKTHGMIPEILKESELFPDALLVLMNAIYFKATWTEKFDSKDTRNETFTTASGQQQQLPMMHRKARIMSAQNDVYTSIELPYGSGTRWSMTVMLPNDGKTIDDIIQSLNSDTWRQVQRSSRTVIADIKIPRFTTKFETDLVKPLTAMGAPSMFDGSVAEFPHISTNYKHELYVALMKQKAAIEVDEEGTKASAVTIAEMKDSAIGPSPEPEKIDFHCNRPFVYVIQEYSSGVVFFVGTFRG